MNIYKSWVKKSLFTFFILVVLIATLNYKIDSLGLYGNSSFLEKAAIALAEKKTVTGMKNLDYRQLQPLIIKNIKQKSDFIVLGSSRSLEIKKEFLLYEDISFLNHSMPGASLEDYIAVIGIYEKLHGYIPKTIILGTDPWIFNKNNKQTRYKTLSNYYNHIIKRLPEQQNSLISEEIPINKYKQLINYDYTRANFNFLRHYIKNDMQAFTIKENKAKKSFTRKIYTRENKSCNIEKINLKAKRYTQGDVYSLEMFNTLNNTKLFEKFVNYLQKNGSRVILFLSPYHPITYDILTKNPKYEMIKKSEKYLHRFAKESSIELYGSFDPHQYNFIDSDFVDGMHSKNFVSQTIFKDFKYLPKGQ